MRLPRRSGPAEIAAFEGLCRRLAGFDPRLDAEWIDGFLTAVVCGPVRPDEARWLDALAGDAFERAFADPPDRAQALAVLRARIAVIEDALDPDALAGRPDLLRLDPWLAAIDEGDQERVADASLPPAERVLLQTGAQWAQGFLEGQDAFAADWQAPAPDDPDRDEIEGLLAPLGLLLLLPGSEDEANYAAVLHPGRDLPARDELIDAALFAVQDLRLWWVDHAPRPAARRAPPTPGRNDPCPCGSGLKFKKCHGAVLPST